MPDRAIIIDTFGNAEEVSDRAFYARIFGHPRRSAAELKAEADAYWAKYREQSRRELEQLRDRLCKLASPKLAAEWRAKWAAEDALETAREERRAA